MRKTIVTAGGVGLAALVLTACGGSLSPSANEPVTVVSVSAEPTTVTSPNPSVSAQPTVAPVPSPSQSPTPSAFPTVTAAPSAPSKQGGWDGILSGAPTKTISATVGEAVTLAVTAPKAGGGISVLIDEANILQLVPPEDGVVTDGLTYRATATGVSRIAVGTGKGDRTNPNDWALYEVNVS